MRSKLAEQLKREEREEVMRMSPAERVALARRLGERGLALVMSANKLDRAAAIRFIRKSRELGRKPSPCLDERH